MMVISMSQAWQREILTYALSYQGNPSFQIIVSYPELKEAYGLVGGSAYLLSLGVMSIFAGIYSDKANRVRLISFACILWSFTSVFSGEVHSFSVFVTMRIFLGVFSSAFKPASISLLRDYFD